MLVTWSCAVGRMERDGLLWPVAALLEAAVASLAIVTLTLGRFSFGGPNPLLWLAFAAGLAGLYLIPNLWHARNLAGVASNERECRVSVGMFTLPFLGLFSLLLVAAYLRPDLGSTISLATAQPTPFPILVLGVGILAIFLLKVFGSTACLRGDVLAAPRLRARAAEVAIPIAFLLLGAFQASVYILPIGNATLRFWAIADGIGAGVGYPLTLTEPGPMSAGSPPYVYDLPLFPALMRVAFDLLGHNSAAAHLPGAISSALFPLALYLLTKEATGSRLVATVFAAITSLLPPLRLWVLNLPDPDPFFLTNLCLAGFFYLRAFALPTSSSCWLVAGLSTGIMSLARPEGILYAACITLALLCRRPGIRQLTLFIATLGLFVAPMVVTWITNFGFLWPENYNKTLNLGHPAATLAILSENNAYHFFAQSLGLPALPALGVLILFVVSALLGTGNSLFRDPRLLALAIPAIGNTFAIFFTNPWISNAFHYADFFRHAAFGIPVMAVMSAYAFQKAPSWLAHRPRWSAAKLIALLLLSMAVIREGDILANPTLIHRPGSPLATQALTANTHLTLESILNHPFQLPSMAYTSEHGVTVAYPSGLIWPKAVHDHLQAFDISLGRDGTPFAYASVVAFLLALAFEVLGEKTLSVAARTEAGGVARAAGYRASISKERPNSSPAGQTE